jgi:hypothetical protein
MTVLLRRTHVVPTHVHTPETAFSIGSVSISVRQFLVLLIGSAISYDLWLHLVVLTGLPGGQIARLLIALVPVGLALAIAFLTIAGRPLETWLLVLLRFWARPRRLVWRSVRFQEWSDGTAVSEGEKGEDACA